MPQTPVCQRTLSYPSAAGDPTVVVTFVGNYQQNVGSGNVVEFVDSNYYGVNCDGYTDLVNAYGGGIAETQLYTSYCNTDGYTPGEGAVQVFDGNSTSGGDVTVAPNFGQWYGSYDGGSTVLYGNFQICSENPVGSHTNYSCVAWSAGPYK